MNWIYRNLGNVLFVTCLPVWSLIFVVIVLEVSPEAPDEYTIFATGYVIAGISAVVSFVLFVALGLPKWRLHSETAEWWLDVLGIDDSDE